MQGQVSDGPVLLLRISEEEYATIQQLIAFVPHMDRAIVGIEQPAIDRLAARLAEAPFSSAAGKGTDSRAGRTGYSLLRVFRGLSSAQPEARCPRVPRKADGSLGTIELFRG